LLLESSIKVYVKRDPQYVFEFLSNPKNWHLLYPNSMNFKIVKLNDFISFKFNLLGQRFEGRSKLKISSLSFSEEIFIPIFKKWIHLCKILPKEEGSLIEEKFEIHLNFEIFYKFIFKRLIKGILKYREEKLKEIFGEKIKASYKNLLSLDERRGLILSLLALLIAFLLPFINLYLSFISWFLLFFFSHDLAHWIVGSLLGIKFSYYYLGLSNLVKIISSPKVLPLVLGLKIDRERSKAGKRAFALMYLSGPITSNLLPLYIPLFILKDTLGLILLIISLFTLSLSLYFSYKAGCIRKALKILKQF